MLLVREEGLHGGIERAGGGAPTECSVGGRADQVEIGLRGCKGGLADVGRCGAALGQLLAPDELVQFLKLPFGNVGP